MNSINSETEQFHVCRRRSVPVDAEQGAGAHLLLGDCAAVGGSAALRRLHSQGPARLPGRPCGDQPGGRSLGSHVATDDLVGYLLDMVKERVHLTKRLPSGWELGLACLFQANSGQINETPLKRNFHQLHDMTSGTAQVRSLAPAPPIL